MGGKWVRAIAEIELKQKTIRERQKELTLNPPKLEKTRFERQAMQTVDQEQPKLKRQFDNACRYLGRQSEEQKRANKTRLDQEREHRSPLKD